MTRGRGTASIVASPVLVGAVTTLIVIVSVFLAYNANKGLPFVPTYDLNAVLPNGSNLVPGNEVRIGGFRVGVVDTIKPGNAVIGGQNKQVAVIKMKLDKSVQPLSRATHVLVRARSALGLKYVQLTPGPAKDSALCRGAPGNPACQTFKAGDTIPINNSTLPVEFDDFLNTFDQRMRQNSQSSLTGFGDALAGRGQSLNIAIQGLAPFFRALRPVMANLANPSTQLDEFFKQIGRASAQVAPVADVQALVFKEMADTFEAIARCADCLRATIEKGPPTEDASIQSFRVQDPFLVDFTDLSRRLQPAARVLPSALPKLSSALTVGTPVVRSSVTLNNETKKLFAALDDLVQDPNTLLSLRDLHDTIAVLNPLANYVAPYQTVCNYAVYFFNGLSGDVGFDVANGTAQAAGVKNANNQQENSPGGLSDRPADVPANVSPWTSTTPNGDPLAVAHGQPYGPAIDAQGNADCQAGQSGYPSGPLLGGPARKGYEPTNLPDNEQPNTPQGFRDFQQFEQNYGGGSHVVQQGNDPGLLGPTFTGVPNLKDVP